MGRSVAGSGAAGERKGQLVMEGPRLRPEPHGTHSYPRSRQSNQRLVSARLWSAVRHCSTASNSSSGRRPMSAAAGGGAGLRARRRRLGGMWAALLAAWLGAWLAGAGSWWFSGKVLMISGKGLRQRSATLCVTDSIRLGQLIITLLTVRLAACVSQRTSLPKFTETAQPLIKLSSCFYRCIPQGR